MSGALVSLGDLVLDVIKTVRLPITAGHYQHSPARRLEPGGAGGVMITAQRLGVPVRCIGVVGEDVFGQEYITRLGAEGVDTTLIHASPAEPTTLVEVFTDDEAHVHTFISSGGCTLPLDVTPSHLAAVQSAGAVFLQAFTLLEDAVRPAAVALVQAARAAKVPVFFDAGPFMARLGAEDTAWVLAHADVLMLTEDELPGITALTGDAAYADLLAQCPHLLVIKRGAAGCLLVEAHRETTVPGFAVPVVDTVGAGDCFDGAFIAAYLQGMPYAQCAQVANAAGAVSVQKVAAGSLSPTRDEVNALLRPLGLTV